MNDREVLEVASPLRDVPETGIVVRACLDGAWGAYDIAFLTRESLYAWLRSRGGSNPWAEDTVAILLGHRPMPRTPETLP